MKYIITQVPGPVLKFYDTGKHVTVQVDASQSGLSCTSTRWETCGICFQSLASNPASIREKDEKEALALVFGCEKFHHYLYGRDFDAETTNL
jgi:hypothetical protein